MRIIAKRALREFWERYPDAESWLQAWHDQVRREDWDSPATIQRHHPRASIVGNDRVVFRIRGNNYRMVLRVFFPGRIAYIRFIGTHAEYDRLNVKEV